MSDDEDIFDAVSPQQQIAPLPCVPPNQGPVSIPLSVLLDFAVQKVYQELTIKIQLLPNMSDLDSILWNFLVAISCFLSQQCSYFVETADSLYQLSRENLSDARLPVFQIPAAVEVLTLGTYSRLPLSLRTRFVPDDPIKPKEQACVLQRLNQIIIYKLINQSQNLPVKYRIKNGVVTFRVENEFESSLTLLGETSDLPWTLLNLKILVEDYDIGEGTDLVHPQQVHYLHQVVQTRIEASSTPIIEMFNILHSFCLSLRLDVLCCQTSKLIYDRLNDNVSIGEYRNGQKLVILYWKDMGGDLPVKTQSQPFTPIQYKIVIDIVTASNNMKTLRINHVPSSNADLPMVKDYEGENGIEFILLINALAVDIQL
uniref:Mediator of RNA polymerase II transcription subunit 14 n=1 Tax=Romanomermis culicivorax TaxID=13658 RepID=A0A915ITZ7_ROMCU